MHSISGVSALQFLNEPEGPSTKNRGTNLPPNLEINCSHKNQVSSMYWYLEKIVVRFPFFCVSYPAHLVGWL